jgi:tRNA (Thr-GGU) A37 N-methylase
LYFGNGICSPVRPNPIGMSVLEVLEVEDTTVHVSRLDMLEGTPILDIKPYIDDEHSRLGCSQQPSWQ